MKFERTGQAVKRKYGRHRGIGMALLAVAAAICIAACGGSSNAASTTKSTTAKTSSTASKTSKSNTFTALRACLTKHGVTLPSRAGHRGGSFFGGGTGTTGGAGTAGTGTPPTGGPPTGAPGAGGGRFAGGANSKFAKAFKACGGKAGGFRGGFGGGYPGAGGAPGAGTGHFRPAFTKATLTAFVACVRKNGYPAMPEAKTNTTTGGFFPRSIESNPKFKKASAKCASVLKTAAGSVSPGGATTITSSSST
jgi:hypothetical protein